MRDLSKTILNLNFPLRHVVHVCPSYRGAEGGHKDDKDVLSEDARAKHHTSHHRCSDGHDAISETSKPPLKAHLNPDIHDSIFCDVFFFFFMVLILWEKYLSKCLLTVPG